MIWLSRDHAPVVWLVAAGSLLGLAGIVALLGHAVRRSSRMEVAAVVALTAVALALRLAVPWGPHDLNLRQPGAWVDVTRHNVGYGLGWTGLAVMARPIWPGGWALRSLPDLGALLSCLHVPLLVAWARGLGSGPRTAWLAGALLAVHPAWVRYGHTDVQVIPETLWTLTALVAIERWRRGGAGGPALAGLATGLAVHARPEALVLPLALGALAALRLGRRASPGGVAQAAGVALVVGAPQVVLQLGRLVTVEQGAAGVVWEEWWEHPVWTHGWRHLVALDPAWVPPWIALGLLGLPWAREPGALTRLAVVGVGLALALLVAGDPSWTPVDGDRMGFARHQLRALPFLLLALAWGWGAGLERLRVGAWAWGGLGLSAAATLPLAWQPRAAALEFRWLAAWREMVPVGCTIYAPAYGQDAGLRLAHELLWTREIALRTDPPPAEGEPGCWLYYRSGECSVDMDPPLEACERFEATRRLEPVAERWLPAVPWIYDPYRVDPVRVGLYRVGDLRAEVDP